MSTSDCPCTDDTTPCGKGKEEDTSDKEKDDTNDSRHKRTKCPPQGLHPYVAPGSTPPDQPILPLTVRQPCPPYAGLCQTCSITRNLPDAFRCSIPPHNEARRQNNRKCRDLSSCVPQSSDQLVIYNTFCPSTSKGKTSPSIRMTTLTNFRLDGPEQFIFGSIPPTFFTPAIPIPQIIQWNTTINDGSYYLDLRDATTRSFNTGWLDSEYFQIATPGTYSVNLRVTFIGVGSILGFLGAPKIFTQAVIFLQNKGEFLNFNTPFAIGDAPFVYVSTTLNVVEPETFRYWIVTLFPGIIYPQLSIRKINEASGTSIEHLNVTRGPNFSNPSPNS